MADGDDQNPLFAMEASTPDDAKAEQAPAAVGDNPLFSIENQGHKHASVYDEQQDDDPNLKWGDVAGEAARNAAPSAVRFGKSLAAPFIHPVDTAANIYGLGRGVASKVAGLAGMQQDAGEKDKNEAMADAAGHYFKNRYGSEQGFKNALAHDPIGVVSDLSSVLVAPETLAGKVPGAVGTFARASSTVGDAINPLNIALKATKVPRDIAASGLSTLASPVFALKSGTSGSALRTIREAGRATNSIDPEVRATGLSAGNLMRGEDSEVIAERAHTALGELADQRRNDYLNSQAGWRANQATLPFNKIHDAIDDAKRSITHGSMVIDPEASMLINGTPSHPGLSDTVLDWQTAPPTTMPNGSVARYDNVEGLDKLKRRLGAFRSDVRPGSLSDKTLTSVQDAVRQTIMDHDSTYHDAMGRYGDATDNMNQIRQALSLKEGANPETQLRKFAKAGQGDGPSSGMLDELEQTKSGRGIKQLAAGAALHQKFSLPGLGYSLLTSGIGNGAAWPGLGGIVAHATNILTSSPRVNGEMYYKLGQHLGDYSTLRNGLRSVGTAGIKSKWLLPAKVDSMMPGKVARNDDEDPYFRPARASGGRVINHASEAQKLISMAERSRKGESIKTEPLLNLHDDIVATALKTADKHI